MAENHRVGIVGSTGRVGNLLIDSLLHDSELPLSVVHVFDELKRDLPSDVLVTNSMEKLLENCDIVIDFSAPTATQSLLESALENPKALVIATTGFTEHQNNLMTEASTKMPLLYASNMSAGIALLKQLVEQVSKTLQDFDIEIVEQHHKH
ncbi:MAG: 4-hydroxy-tetrahydrodipicolinate reductase, partial [Sulfurovum sp.]|nr:4-hydroxy-tetrahydrodipicolinate reductase [Sulfurovum sp.]